jgi:hypothetical protein
VCSELFGIPGEYINNFILLAILAGDEIHGWLLVAVWWAVDAPPP